VGADGKKRERLFFTIESEHDSILVGQTDGVETIEIALEGIEPQLGLKRIDFESLNGAFERRSKIGMLA
jgi:hypothetical protein